MQQANESMHVVMQIQDFDCKQTFECGQCFRWNFDGSVWHGIVQGRELFIHQDGDVFDFYPCTQQEFDDFWVDYFDLQRDYAAVKQQLQFDERVAQGIEYAGGIHILRQEPFEILISFIISANNNIKRIKRIIENICEAVGRPAGSGYAFPTPEELSRFSVDELHDMGAGYRARYIHDTARVVADGFDMEKLKDLDYDSTRKRLCQLCGVGPKVADCIMLFSLGFTRAFPVDTWVQKSLDNLYSDYAAQHPQEFAYERFGDNAGFAQQYLFHYERNRNEEE